MVINSLFLPQLLIPSYTKCYGCLLIQDSQTIYFYVPGWSWLSVGKSLKISTAKDETIRLDLYLHIFKTH